MVASFHAYGDWQRHPGVSVKHHVVLDGFEQSEGQDVGVEFTNTWFDGHTNKK